MEELFECIELLLPVIGYPVFSNVASSTTQDDVLYCEGAGIKASAKYTDAGMVVLKGSEMRSGTTPTASKGIQYLRKTLVDQAYVSLDADTYIFREDYAFTSPSAAAQVVLGRSANGWTAWKNAAGKTLDEVIRQS